MLNELLDLIYPRFCYICNKSLKHSKNLYFCFSCWYKLPLIRKNLCLKCAMPMGEGIGVKKKCNDCNFGKFYFKQIRSAGKYKDSLRKVLLNFKFKGMVELRHPLAALIYWQLKHYPFSGKIDLIIPVPMYHKQRIQRGYNQAELLADCLAKLMRIPCVTNILIKIKETLPQSGLDRTQREKNLTNKFIATKKLKDKTVLLVDDIFTTGTTVNECSKALKKSNVKKIYVATAAKSLTEY